MADYTFTPAIAPSLGLSLTEEARVLQSEFGDGYTQRSGDGLNNLFLKGSVTWNKLTQDQADAIIAFFRLRQGYESFNYTLPYEDSSRQFICKKWTPVQDEYDSVTLTADFEEVFDI